MRIFTFSLIVAGILASPAFAVCPSVKTVNTALTVFGRSLNDGDIEPKSLEVMAVRENPATQECEYLGQRQPNNPILTFAHKKGK